MDAYLYNHGPEVATILIVYLVMKLVNNAPTPSLCELMTTLYIRFSSESVAPIPGY